MPALTTKAVLAELPKLGKASHKNAMLAASKRIGVVEVEIRGTGSKVPSAPECISKVKGRDQEEAEGAEVLRRRIAATTLQRVNLRQRHAPPGYGDGAKTVETEVKKSEFKPAMAVQFLRHESLQGRPTQLRTCKSSLRQ